MDQFLQISFTGEYHYSIDSKGRLNIPSKFRKALNPINNCMFVVTRGFDRCIVLYPLDEWKQVESQLRNLSSIRKGNREFTRKIVRHAVTVKYDSQGRIQIPESLLSYANIKKNANIIGMIKKIEIWDQEELEKHELEVEETDPIDFEELANKINF